MAVSIADQHMLEKNLRENEDTGKDWMRKAEIAVDKKEDYLARAALDRYQTSQRLAESYREQVADQKLTDDVHEKLSRLDRDNEIERLLADLKARRGLPA